jgi:hypothetical protein
MDERELFEWFSKEQMETDEMLSTLEKGAEAGKNLTTGYTEKTKGMQSKSDLEERWSEDESDTANTNVAGTETGDVETVDTESSDDDVKLS